MQEQAGFKTSMFGFRKADVLKCIDHMSAEMLEAQDAAMLREQELEENLESACSEKEALATVAEEKSAEITTLRDAIVQQQALLHEAEAKTVSVQQQLAEAESAAHDYKTRLFSSEGEATILRRDNAQLTQVISQKEKALEDCEQEAKSFSESAAQQLSVAQDKMRASARDMTEDVRLLKEALTTLDEKIECSLHDLQRSTDTLSKALEVTEQNMQSLGVKLEIFPEVHKTPSARATQYHRASAQAKTVHAPVTHKHPLPKSEVKTPTISSLLLAKIGKMIGEV